MTGWIKPYSSKKVSKVVSTKRKRKTRLKGNTYNVYAKPNIMPTLSVKKRVNLGYGIPDKVFTKLIYTDRRSVAVGAPSLQITWRANSLYDPDYAIGGGQPLYRDQIALLYSKYKVHAIKYQIDMVYADVPTTVTCVANDDSSTFATARDAMEQPHSQTRTFTQVSGNIKTITGYFDVVKILGIPKGGEHKELEAAIGSDPTKDVFLHVRFDSVAGGNITTVQVVTKLVYYSEFFQRKLIADV